MVPALLTPRWPGVLGHAVIGASTGFMVEQRGDWPTLARAAAEHSTAAVELAALSGPELPGLIQYLDATPSLPFMFVSAHAPSKEPQGTDWEMAELLSGIAAKVQAIVIHPDVLNEPEAFRPLGSKLVIENMDERKETGKTAEQLAPFFETLPEAGLCFDVPHAKSVDPTMRIAGEILNRFGSRLRHVHLSSLDEDSHHVPLTKDDERLFSPLLARCRDVPWIMEAPLR